MTIWVIFTAGSSNATHPSATDHRDVLGLSYLATEWDGSETESHVY